MEKTLPIQLRNESFNFISLHGKNPAYNGKDWQNSIHPWQEAEKWIQSGKNYGVMTGHGGLIVIDADCKAVAKAVEEWLPATFTVRTGSGNFHYYYLCPELTSKIVLDDKLEPSLLVEGEHHYGEVLTRGFQAVGPESIHPDTGEKYEVVRDLEIKNVTREEVYSSISQFLKPVSEFSLPPITIGSPDHSDIESLKITDILPNVTKSCVIPHPVHGATGGGNLHLDIEKNVWRCFRCESGGGALALLAVMEGIISCDESQKGILRGDKFREVVEVAKNRGLVLGIKQSQHSTPAQNNEPLPLDFLSPLSLFELSHKVFPPEQFLLEPYFESGTLNMITAPPNGWKSWIMIDIAIAIAEGSSWLGNHKTEQHKVWLINEEDSEHGVEMRTSILGAKEKNIPLYISAMKGFKGDNIKHVRAVIEKCKELGVTVVMFDTLRSINNLDENSSTQMQELIDNLKLFLREGITVVMNHHHKKKKKDDKYQTDDAEMFRGSSAISAAVSGHISLEEETREDGIHIVLKHLKSKISEKLLPADILINKEYEKENGNIKVQNGRNVVKNITFKLIGNNAGEVFSTQRAKEEVLRILKENKDTWMSTKDIISETKSTEKIIRNVLALLFDLNLVHLSNRKALGQQLAGKGNQNAQFFMYREPADSVQNTLSDEEVPF